MADVVINGTNGGTGADNGAGATGGNGSNGGTCGTDKTFTQEQLNNIVARETKKAQESFLKDAGFTDFNTLKEGLAKYKEWQDSTKSEIQKLTEGNAKYKQQVDTLTTELNDLKAERKLLKAGVKPDYASDFYALVKVSGVDDFDKAVKAVSEKHPYMLNDTGDGDNGKNKGKNNGSGSNVNFGVRTKGTGSEIDERLSAFKKRAGINK